MSPFCVASLIRRLCPPAHPSSGSSSNGSSRSSSSNSRGIVVAPFDRYGIVAAGSALACHDFVGLIPLFPNEIEGGKFGLGSMTNAHVLDFLRQQGIVPQLGLTPQQEQVQVRGGNLPLVPFL